MSQPSTQRAGPPVSHPQAAVGIGWRHPHYGELLHRQPAIDFLEVHSENFFAHGGAAWSVLERGRADYAVSLHGVGLSLGSALGVDPWHLDQLARLVARVDPVRVSDHACFARGLLHGRPVHAADLLPIPFSMDALQVLGDNVQRVQDRLRRPLVVENLSAYLQWCGSEDQGQQPDLAEPEFLAALARRTGCLLLVDVNNLYVNALNAQLRGAPGDPLQACRDWLDAMAPASVGEIHLAGHCHVNDEHGAIVIDDHGSAVGEPVWALYRHAVQRFGPVPALVEWDTAIPPLDTLLAQAQRARAVAVSVAAEALA